MCYFYEKLKYFKKPKKSIIDRNNGMLHIFCLSLSSGDGGCLRADIAPIWEVIVGKHGKPGAARWPGEEMDWKRMSSIGFRWVICACSEDPGYDPFPLKFLARIGLTDLSDGGPPDNARAEFEQIVAIASQAYAKLNEGGILVHCVGGRGRTGTILGAILRHCGYDAAEVTTFLDTAYRDAGRPGWPESPWQSQVVERIKPTGQAHYGSSEIS